MQVWADFLDLLRDKGEVVDFQTARQQIESSLAKSDKRLTKHNKHIMINALLNQGLTREDLKRFMIESESIPNSV